LSVKRERDAGGKGRRTRNELELRVQDHGVVGVVAPGDLAAVVAVADAALDGLAGEGDLEVAAEAGGGGLGHCEVCVRGLDVDWDVRVRSFGGDEVHGYMKSAR
jgi:hypothetical protein